MKSSKGHLTHIATPENALESERTLLARVRSGEVDSALSVWSTNNALVVPRRVLRNPYFDHARKRSEARGWPVTVRDSGGDVTPQGLGIINVTYAYCCRRYPSIEESYRVLCRPIIDLASSFGHVADCKAVDGSFCDGQYNVVTDQKKLAGTAQRRSRRHGQGAPAVLFAHALILVNANIVASVNAINHFNRDCGQPTTIDAGVHVNVFDLAAPAVTPLLEDVADSLYSQYFELLRSV